MSATPTDASTDAPLLIERDGAIVTLRFHRPGALNAVDVPMAQALRDAARALAQDASVRCVVLCGAGKGFMAGGDLATLRADPVQGARALLEPLNEAATLLAQLDAPVIAQVHGVAAGAGLSLMLQADFVLAADNARFNLAYINLGTSCDVGASWALPRLVGLNRALEIALLGDAFTAPQAQQWGLIHRAVPAAELVPVREIDDHPIEAPGEITKVIAAKFDDALHGRAPEYAEWLDPVDEPSKVAS